MPELLWLYRTALLYDRTLGSYVALAEALETVSHDRLTRRLQRDWSGQTRLELACRTWFGWQRGARIIADTVRPKPFAAAIEGLAWGYSSQERQPVYGLSRVLWVWTDGTLRLPLGMRLWRTGGASTSVWALAWLSYARHRLRGRPDDVLLDAWYPSRRLLKRIRDDGWSVVCRLNKNRRFNGRPVRHHRQHPSWVERGWLSGGVNVLVVRYGNTYDATHRLTRSSAEVRRLYRWRAHIEAVIRVCKDQRTLTGGQARAEQAQQHHITCCVVALCVLERERHDRQLSLYQLKRQFSVKGRAPALSALEQRRRAA